MCYTIPVGNFIPDIINEITNENRILKEVRLKC